MKLHDAIIEILNKNGKPMTTNAIALELSRLKLYTKRDGSTTITGYQVHGRTKNYTNLFEIEGSLVSLKNKKITQKTKKTMPLNKNNKSPKISGYKNINDKLTDNSNFKDAAKIDDLVPDKAGLYCIKIKKPHSLPSYFTNILINKRKHNILYIGIATTSLKKRMLNQELRAKGHGTFFRSLGAVLGYCPPFNSLSNKKNKRNYKFSKSDEDSIIKWINKNLIINWVETEEPEKYEQQLIKNHSPLLNLDHNPNKLEKLSELRKNCVDVANGIKESC